MEQQNQSINNAKLQVTSNNLKIKLIDRSKLVLLFNLYDNRLIHEKFLDQIFENLIENKQTIKYDFQKKIYSLYPENYYSDLNSLNKVRALSILSLIYLLLRYIRYRKLMYENFIFLKIYLKTISKVFHLRISLICLLIRKNLGFSKLKFYKTYKILNKAINTSLSFLIFNYLDYKVVLNKKLSNKSYIAFYKSDTTKN